MKNILIIGGSYFAGRILVEELIKEKDNNIFVYNRGNLPLRLQGVTELVGDRENETSIKEVIPDKKWDVLVDFCAYTPEHIEMMIRALSGALKHYIFISTTTVYENVLDLPVNEDAPKLLKPQPELGEYAEYGMNKWLAECKLKQMCESQGIAFTSLRPAIIYGEYNYAPRESYFFDLLRDKKPVILPDNELALFSFVWVVDVVRIIIKCLGNQQVFGKAFNVSAKDLISYKRLLEVIEKVSGKKFEIITMSVDEINRRQIPLPFPLDGHLVYSGTSIQSVLDFEYTPFEDGMRKTYDYYQLLQKHK